MGSKVVVETVNLTKVYEKVTAVNKLNLKINSGEIFGFLGPNGAGKTTTILMLLGLTEPTSGTARISGFDSTKEPLKVKSICGYVPEKVGFYESLTASYNLLYTARLNGLSDKEANKRIGEALDTVGLASVAARRVGTFSRGMKQRLALADVLVKMPQVAFLDEPTASIDPRGIVEILDLIKKISTERQMTVVVSSHQLPQAQRICTRFGIMSGGSLVAQGSVEELSRRAAGAVRFRVEVELSEVTQALIDAVKRVPRVLDVEWIGDKVVVSCNDDLRPQIAKAIVEANGSLVQMRIQSFALEDIYMKYFGGGS